MLGLCYNHILSNLGCRYIVSTHLEFLHLARRYYHLTADTFTELACFYIRIFTLCTLIRSFVFLWHYSVNCSGLYFAMLNRVTIFSSTLSRTEIPRLMSISPISSPYFWSWYGKFFSTILTYYCYIFVSNCIIICMFSTIYNS